MVRWIRFNAVGLAGAVVQLSALWFCSRVLGIHYVVSTILAVELAVLHNFAWHEAWTWRGLPVEYRWHRLIRFHLANGLASVVSNALLTWLFKQRIGLPLLAANLLAITVTSVINFCVANAWVFRRAQPSWCRPRAKGDSASQQACG